MSTHLAEPPIREREPSFSDEHIAPPSAPADPRTGSPRKPFRAWKLITALLVVIAIAVIVSIVRKQDLVQVRAATAHYQDLARLVTTNGSVVPTDEFQARANFPGIVQKVAVELGDK